MKSSARTNATGHCTVAGGIGITIADYAHELRMPAHSHDEAMLVLILRGTVREHVRKDDRAAGPLEIGFKPAGLRHSDRFAPGGLRAVRLRFPHDHDLRLGGEGSLPDRWLWTASPAAARALMRLAGCARDGQSADASNHLFEALDAIRDDPPVRTSSRWIDGILEEMEDRKHGRLSVAQFAHARDMTPLHFTRAFRAAAGVSFTAWLRRRRVAWAASELAATRRPVSEIAMAAGFYDHPQFVRQFRRELGVPPSAYRRLAAG